MMQRQPGEGHQTTINLHVIFFPVAVLTLIAIPPSNDRRGGSGLFHATAGIDEVRLKATYSVFQWPDMPLFFNSSSTRI